MKNPWIWLGLAIVLALGAMFIPSGAPSFSTDRQRHVVPVGGYDSSYLGNIQPGKQLTPSFEIENKLKSPVTVAGVYTSCGCSKVTIEANTLEQGQRTNVKVLIDAGTVKGMRSVSISIAFENGPPTTFDYRFNVVK